MDNFGVHGLLQVLSYGELLTVLEMRREERVMGRLAKT